VEVEGDYVTGDKVDRSTSVEDSVLNRSDVGGEAAADGSGARPGRAGSVEVDDSVVNRSNVGGGGGPAAGDQSGARSSDATDTQNFCPTHERTYQGEECPDCAAANDYCEDCGAELPGRVKFCPSCGSQV
jgi:membrane protease subunit (stomatin/prohibitin family)